MTEFKMPPRNVNWLYEGQIVYVRATLINQNAPKNAGFPCRVVTASGNAANVISLLDKHAFKRTMLIEDLWVGPLTEGGY